MVMKVTRRVRHASHKWHYAQQQETESYYEQGLEHGSVL
ncbi:MAG: hypothetical protein OJF50_006544 [Nitrospira sp.]|jgi:hypothetical protein|nr:hypothetical protein [Nitrospira sp.]